MSAIRYSPPAKVKGVCWTEEEALGLNIVVKEEKEEEDVTVKNEVTLDGEVVTVKEEEVTVKEEEDAFRVKEENAVFSVKKDGEITVILKEEEEEKTGDLINTISPPPCLTPTVSPPPCLTPTLSCLCLYPTVSHPHHVSPPTVSHLHHTLSVSSGKYPGLIWDDNAKTMFRIPWKHAGNQDFRSEDGAIFKAWAVFKGKLSDGSRADPSFWKTRLRCALNKSPEFREVSERSQLDISQRYKVYRLVPINEQGETHAHKRMHAHTQLAMQCFVHQPTNVRYTHAVS
ncbi:unnamed protein product [Coregonus sp. 'balchen']|nr:unnamed protein product [Coregonus sp. 'balchen']